VTKDWPTQVTSRRMGCFLPIDCIHESNVNAKLKKDNYNNDKDRFLACEVGSDFQVFIFIYLLIFL